MEIRTTTEARDALREIAELIGPGPIVKVQRGTAEWRRLQVLCKAVQVFAETRLTADFPEVAHEVTRRWLPVLALLDSKGDA